MLYSHRRWLEAGNFGFRKKRDCSIYVVKKKALISCGFTAQLICGFVFAYAKSQFSHDAAQFINAANNNGTDQTLQKHTFICAFVVQLDRQDKSEPCCEKSCLRGFQPGPTQTRLYSHRRWLEAKSRFSNDGAHLLFQEPRTLT